MSRATQFLAVAFGARLHPIQPLDHVVMRAPGAGGVEGGAEPPEPQGASPAKDGEEVVDEGHR